MVSRRGIFMIDLHIHTIASSDGQHTPREIFQLAGAAGLSAIAFADHNSVASVAAGVAMAERSGIEFIPCLEFNSIFRELDLHMLAYFIDHASPRLTAWLQKIRAEKKRQAGLRVRKLNELGFVFSLQDVEKYAAGREPTGISYLKAIISREENRGDARIQRFIDGERSDSPYLNFYLDYLRGGKPAFVPLRSLDTISVMNRIKELGGIPVLAHPSETGDEIIIALIEGGLSGLEVFSSYHSPGEEAHFLAIAREYDLLVTAGSDFHGGAVKPNVLLGGIRGNSCELVEKLKAARAK
jgi:hypothetical protein